MQSFYTTHHSCIGTLLLVGGAQGLNFIRLIDTPDDAQTLLAREFTLPPRELPDFFVTTTNAIDVYLQTGGAMALPFHIDRGTHLQRAVWVALSRIPYGETISYTTLAERVGFPRAVRAVASACGANPLPLVIPCHRVIAKDGTLGGFSLGGVGVKEQLLALEQHAAKAVA